MPEKITMYKRLYNLGILAYICMLVFSIFFYKERIIFLDTAFSLFHIIKNGFFNIEVYRFGDVFNQLFAVLAVRMGLSINAVMICYSVGYASYFFGCYLICGSVLKQYHLALIVLLLNILFVSDTFYWITSQLPQATALMLVVLSLVAGKEHAAINRGTYVVLVCGVVTLAFFHPLVVFPLLFGSYFLFTNTTMVRDRRILYIILSVFFIGVLVKGTLFRTPYERHSLSGMKNFIVLFPDYFRIWSNKQFLLDCLSKYYWMPILFFSVSAFYIARRDWKQLGFFLCAISGYLFLINVSYPGNTTPRFYIESLYLPLAIFLAFPFVFELLPLLQQKSLAMPAMALIILTGCGRIYVTHGTYTSRINYERAILDKYTTTKVIAKAQSRDTVVLQMLWGTPYELLLLSESEHSKAASIIIDDDPPHRDWAKDQRSALIVNWNIFPYKDMPSRYFHFSDTTSGYLVEQPR